MPGGMGGGMGGLLGGLLGGGMGGPGGGMGGMGGMGGPGGGMGGGMGGMGRNNQTQQSSQDTEDTSDVYDVDRWKRADGMDDGYQELSYDRRTNVQQVRDAWDRDKKEKEGKGLGSRIKSIFGRNKDKEKEKDETPPPVNYTLTTPEMKKVQNRSTNPIANAEKAEKDAQAAQAAQTVQAAQAAGVPPVASVVNPLIQQKPEHAFNYLGLTFPSDIDTFFTSNPINSAILAGDSLSFGPLTMDQVASTEGFGIPPINLVASSVAPAQPAPPVVEQAAAVGGSPPLADSTQNVPPALDNKDVPQPGPVGARGPARNLITERTGTNLMDSYRDSREQRKYEVKIN